MPTFANFEGSEEHHRGATATIWKARGRGGADDSLFALKVCQPSDFLDEGADGTPYLTAAEEVIADLRALEKRKAQNWVEVTAKGADELHVFWATRFFPRSLHTVLERRAQLPFEDIHWIAAAIARGLGDLERLLDRSHGNLKASNIFIDGDGRLRGLPLRLSDLKPRSQLVLPEDRIADFREFGRLIVLIVRRRVADDRKPIAWPIEADVEWRRFGRKAGGWRELCNTLLNPHPAPSDLDWGKVAQRIDELAPAQQIPWGWIAAGVVPLVLAGAGLAYLRLKEYHTLPRQLQPWAERLGNVPIDVATVPPEWAQLCAAYNDWLGAFMDHVSTPGRTAGWAQQRYLQERVFGDLIELSQNYRVPNSGYQPLDPRNLAGIRGGLDALQAAPPDVVKKGVIAHKIVTVANATKQAAQALKDWPERKKLDDLRQRFGQLGWTKAATQLQGAVERTGNGTLAAGTINDALTLSAATARTEIAWRELEQRAATLAGAGDPVMKGLLNYLTARVGAAADVAALNKLLDESSQDVTRWLGQVQGPNGQPRIERTRFTKESGLRDFNGEVTNDVLTRWEREVQDFQFVAESEDPRRKADWTGLFRKVDESLATLRDEEAAAPADATVGGSPFKRFQTARDEVRRHVDDVISPPLVRKDVELAGRTTQTAVTRVKTLDEEVLAMLVQLRPDPVGWLSRVRQVAIGAPGSVLRREWERRREQLLADANPTALARSNIEFRALRDRQAKLEQFFTAVAGPRGVGAFPSLELRGVADDLSPSLQTWGRARVERAVEEWLGVVTWTGAIPAVAADAFIGGDVTRRVLEGLGADFREAMELGAEFSAIAERLVQGDGVEGAAATFAKWNARPILKELGTAAPFRALLDAGTTLAAVRTEERREELIAKASAPSLGIALAAWRRLGELSTWPAVSELDTEIRLTKEIEDRAQKSIRDAGRRTALLAEAAKEKARRWRVAMRGAPNDALLAQVLGRRGEFGVKDADLAPGERFNVELQQLKGVDWRTQPETRIIALRDEAVGKLKAALTSQPVPGPLTSWFGLLLELVLTEAQGGQSDLRLLGPGAAGWRGELSADNRVVTYKKTIGEQQHQLSFALIEGEKSVPFLLGTTEIPAGLFVDLVSDPAVWTKLQRWLVEVVGTNPKDDPRNGPQIWKLRGTRGAAMNTQSWTGSTQPTWPANFYPADVTVPKAPGRDVPLQYIPPQAALYLAKEVLGCRLPTLDEWRALVEAKEPLKMAEPKGPNFRDLLWVRERDYLVANNVPDLPIDADIFWPGNASTQKRGRQAQAAVPDREDGVLWFAPVGGDSTNGVRHLFGNVAEYLFDETSGKFFIAGGSALSPPEVDPATPYPVDTRLATAGFSDVGLRLAFNAPGGIAGRSRLNQLLRNQAFLRP